MTRRRTPRLSAAARKAVLKKASEGLVEVTGIEDCGDGVFNISVACVWESCAECGILFAAHPWLRVPLDMKYPQETERVWLCVFCHERMFGLGHMSSLFTLIDPRSAVRAHQDELRNARAEGSLGW